MIYSFKELLAAVEKGDYKGSRWKREPWEDITAILGLRDGAQGACSKLELRQGEEKQQAEMGSALKTDCKGPASGLNGGGSIDAHMQKLSGCWCAPLGHRESREREGPGRRGVSRGSWKEYERQEQPKSHKKAAFQAGGVVDSV